MPCKGIAKNINSLHLAAPLQGANNGGHIHDPRLKPGATKQDAYSVLGHRRYVSPINHHLPLHTIQKQYIKRTEPDLTAQKKQPASADCLFIVSILIN